MNSTKRTLTSRGCTKGIDAKGARAQDFWSSPKKGSKTFNATAKRARTWRTMFSTPSYLE